MWNEFCEICAILLQPGRRAPRPAASGDWSSVPDELDHGQRLTEDPSCCRSVDLHSRRGCNVRDRVLGMLWSDTRESLHGRHVRNLLAGDHHCASGDQRPPLHLRREHQGEHYGWRRRVIQKEI